MIWADARLTERGVEQARDVHELWREQLLEGMPAPEAYYTSPLMRCCETAWETFSDLVLPHDRPFKVTVKEVSNLTEPSTLHRDSYPEVVTRTQRGVYL